MKPLLDKIRTAFTQRTVKSIWAVPLPAASCVAVFFAGVMLGWPGYVAAADGHAASGFGVRITSLSPGHLFTDSDLPVMRVQVNGAKAAVSVDYAVKESSGPWNDKGRLDVLTKEGGSGEAPLPLKFPGRGLYQVMIEARSGEAHAKAETWVAIVFTPAPPSEDSPWGIFYAPHVWFDKENPEGPRWSAIQHRRLGASWSRLNFWAHSFEKVTVTGGGKPTVTAEYPMWRKYAKELRKEGIFIMGEIAQCHRELSSRPDDEQQVGDAGAVYNRVKPRDYNLWNSMMEKLAADFRDEIQVWEIWNEPNLENNYWTGTVEDFAELVKQTSAAFRRGNPKTRIASAGFVKGHDYLDKLLTLGMGKHIDILTIHYTDETPRAIDGYKSLLDKHNLRLPIWNSEEKSEVPIRNIAGGIERSFKFIQVDIGYPEFRPLARKDWTILPAGILFSVGAHCIGNGQSVGSSDKVPGYDVYFFRRGDEVVGVFDPLQKTGDIRLFGPLAAHANVNAERLAPSPTSVEPVDSGPRITDAWGRSKPLQIENGRATIPLEGNMIFVNGCRTLDVISSEVSDAASLPQSFEAESGRFSKGWGISKNENFSGGKLLEIWAKDDPGPDGHWVELDFDISREGNYEILFSGNTLVRLKSPRSLSPFQWKIDDGEEHEVKDAPPVISGITGAPEGLSVLGTVALSKGEHTFRLKLTGRREQPDQHYSLWFDAIGLRPVEERK